MLQTGAVFLTLAGLLAIVVGSAGKDGKLWNIAFPAPLKVADQKVVKAAGIVAMTFGIFVFAVSVIAPPADKDPTSAATPGGAGSSTHGGAAQSAKPSAPAAPAVLKQGDVTLNPGEALSMETGKVGKVVAKPDIAFVGSSYPHRLVPSNGRIAKVDDNATPSNCAKELTGEDASSRTYVGPGDVFCVVTSARHLASVQVIAMDLHDGRTQAQLHYVVWNT